MKRGSALRTIYISPGQKITLRAGRVFDGNSLLTGEYVDIVISGGLINKIIPFPTGSASGYTKEGEVISLADCTVLPGLVDCHVHLALDGRDFRGALELWPQENLLLDRIGRDLQNTLDRGIMAVRDGGDREWIGLRARDRVSRGLLPGPRVLASGIALGKKGRYGSFLGPGITGDQIKKSVEEAALRGVDQIKVLVSGVVSFKNYGRVGELQFTPAELREVVSAAHGRGLRVMAHASSDGAAGLAVKAGANSLEHGYFIGRQTLEAMAGAGIAWIPTLAPVAVQARGQSRKSHTPEELEVIEKTFRRQMAMVKWASGQGVTLGVGTDAGAAGVCHGEGYLEELMLMQEAGLSREAILQAATQNGAIVLGLDRQMGAVRPGFQPFLIAVRGNPLDDLGCLKNMELMIMPQRG